MCIETLTQNPWHEPQALSPLLMAEQPAPRLLRQPELLLVGGPAVTNLLVMDGPPLLDLLLILSSSFVGSMQTSFASLPQVLS